MRGRARLRLQFRARRRRWPAVQQRFAPGAAQRCPHPRLLRQPRQLVVRGPLRLLARLFDVPLQLVLGRLPLALVLLGIVYRLLEAQLELVRELTAQACERARAVGESLGTEAYPSPDASWSQNASAAANPR